MRRVIVIEFMTLDGVVQIPDGGRSSPGCGRTATTLSHLLVFPTVAGAGERLFDGTPPAELALTSSEAAGPTVLLTYERA